MKIYTKSGDKGETSLYGGIRVPKYDPRVEAYGTVDELQSAIGVATAEVKSQKLKVKNKAIDTILMEIQSDLFFIGAMLAGDKRNLEFRIKNLELRTKSLEKQIDWMAGKMPLQKHFILPGGSKSSSFLHLARSICRRAERRTVFLVNQTTRKPDNQKTILVYLNRLSDFLYTLAKWINYEFNVKEKEWIS